MSTPVNALACPEVFDVEIVGSDHPRTYCRYGCGCWIYQSPAPGCHMCSEHPGLCNSHTSGANFMCAIEGCPNYAYVRSGPDEFKRTPEEEKKLWDMIAELEAKEREST